MKGKGLFNKDIQWRGEKELVKKRTEFRKELYEGKMKNAIRWLKQTHKIPQLKKKIARINFVLTSKSKSKNGDNMK
jgi:ribosomal protein L29